MNAVHIVIAGCSRERQCGSAAAFRPWRQLQRNTSCRLLLACQLRALHGGCESWGQGSPATCVGQGSNLPVQACCLAEQFAGGNTGYCAEHLTGATTACCSPAPVPPCEVCAVVLHLPVTWAAHFWGVVAASTAVMGCRWAVLCSHRQGRRQTGSITGGCSGSSCQLGCRGSCTAQSSACRADCHQAAFCIWWGPAAAALQGPA